MSFVFGKKFTKDDLNESSGISGFQGPETRVRFVEEVDEWLKVYEHFSQTFKQFYPCIGANCPGCAVDDERESKPNRKYIAAAILADDPGESVNLYRVPTAVVNTVVRRFEREGTNCNRDFTVYREGQGMRTKYEVEYEDADPKPNLEKLRRQAKDKQVVLGEMFRSRWGVTAEEYAKGGKINPPTPRASDEDEEKPKEAAPRRRRRQAEDDEPPYSKQAPQKRSTEPAEDFVIDEDELREMSLAELSEVYSKLGIEFPHNLKRIDGNTEQIVDYLIMEIETQFVDK